MKKNKRTQLASGILFLSFACLFLIIAGRFLYIQVSGEVEQVTLDKWAKEKRTNSYELTAERGKILDKNNNALAYNRPTYRLYANVDKEHAKSIEKPKETAKLLAPILDTDKAKLTEKITKGLENDKAKQIEFGHAGSKLTKKQKDQIEDLKLQGIHLMEESIRYYPNGEFASHIIGFAKKEVKETKAGNEKVIMGITGIEKAMNDLLTGKNGSISYERDLFNKKLIDPNEMVKPPKNGHDIHLTIDQKIQTLLEDVLTQVEAAYDPKRLIAIVMNPKTGEVLALSNRPSFNPNKPLKVKNWYNDAISNPFEPGSTVKMFTWAAAIEEGVYNGSEGFKSGRYRINERVVPINDHNGGKGWGTISYDEGFERSSNVAAARLVWDKLGTEKFLEYIEAFDLDKKTGINLPGEVPGKILYNWPLEKVTTGFGQGSTLTPMQQMKAATAIANDGKMMKPYVISKIIDTNKDEIIEKHEPTMVGEPISKDTSKQVLQLLESVVHGKHGTGKPFKLDDYSVAGKTGTAQIPSSNGGYLNGYGNNIFSFLGMAPADDPKLMMYIAINQPDLKKEDGGYEPGSAPLAYIFKNVMENGLHYLNIEPDQDKSEEIVSIKVPKLMNKSTKEVEKQVKKLGIKTSIIGEGKKIVASNLQAGKEVFPTDHLILITDKPSMPNLKGWSYRDVLQLSDLLQLKIKVNGSGYVDSQSIKEGKLLKKNDLLTVELKLPNNVKRDTKSER